MTRFKAWLLSQAEKTPFGTRNDIVSDLANDAKRSGTWPDSNDYHFIYKYLGRHNANADVIRAFRHAYLEWKDEGLSVEELSWDIKTRYNGNRDDEIKGASWEDLASELEDPDTPVYSERQREANFRKGYYYGFSDVVEFLSTGGLPRQLRQWEDRVLSWWLNGDFDEIDGTPSSPVAWNVTRKRILKRDKFVCQYCEKPSSKSVDHIMPIALGGTDDDSNLVACCKKCNSQKHKSHPYDWPLSAKYLNEHPDIAKMITT